MPLNLELYSHILEYPEHVTSKNPKSSEDAMLDRLKAAGKLSKKGDEDGALFQLMRLEAEGDVTAKIVLARAYESGSFGVKRDIDTAMRIYKELEDKGEPIAFLRLAQLYFIGEFVPQNYDRAFYYYSILADAGDAVARFVIGDFYQRGLHAEQDQAAAFQWFKSAAEKGHLYAAKNVAVIQFQNGYYVRELSRIFYLNIVILLTKLFRSNSRRLARF